MSVPAKINPSPQLVLGIESSCDETAAALYHTQKGILAHVLSSQTALHKSYGGVVPEIASRAQLEKITHVIEAVLEQANLMLNQIDTVAVTYTPGLVGSLLVGVCFAKALAYGAQKSLVGVNHLEAHAFSPLLEHTIPFPFLCLTASGGHTNLYLIESLGQYTVLGQTHDDAAGEVFDKVAKMLGYGYPGGPIIEKLAQNVQFHDFFRYPRLKTRSLSFSFSGLKTAVLYDLVAKGVYNLETKTFLAPHNLLLKEQVASSLLNSISTILVDRVNYALEQYPHVKAVAFAGGVACNNFISTQLTHCAERWGIPFYKPSPVYCTDNGAMIAFVGHYKAQKREFADLTLDVIP